MAESEFFTWLRTERPDSLIYRMYADADDWKAVQNLDEAFALINADDDRDAAAKAHLKDSAALSMVAFHKSQAKRNWFGGATPYGIGVFLFMAGILGILAGAIFEPLFIEGPNTRGPLLDRLKDIETARGLITFVFTVGVIALALIIVTANVTGADEEGKRFERSKEILTSMIAILGTILGFYFGISDNDPDPDETVQTDPAGQGGDNEGDEGGDNGADQGDDDDAADAEDDPPEEDGN